VAELRELLPLSEQVVVFIISFLIAVVVGFLAVPVLRRLKFGQTIREDGPRTHLKKQGIPTMGGVIFLAPLSLITLYLASKNTHIVPLLFVTLGFGAVGFLDDYLKIKRKSKDGLMPNQKMLALIVIATVFTVYTVYFSPVKTNMAVPFLGLDHVITLPYWIYIPLIILVLISSTNAVNLTDGIDGLAASVTLVIMVFFTVVAMSAREYEYIMLFSAATAGGCLGFLVFNLHPARVFMGDTGSLALGGAVASISIYLGIPWILLIIGFIYIIETLSVIIQVASFKKTGRRVFKMAPVHHHFELSGWKENHVVLAFVLVTILCCIIGFATLKLNLL